MQPRAEVPRNVLVAIVLGTLFVGVALVSLGAIVLRDDIHDGMSPIDASRALLLADIRRARNRVTA